LKWSHQVTPSPAEEDSELLGVSCASAEACTAVGRSLKSTYSPLAESWNGKEWTIQATPIPAGSKSTQLFAVSCTSAEACTAVGRHAPSSGGVATLAERWNGKEWTIQATPNPVGSKGSELLGVSCSSGEACTAVGSYINASGVVVTLAERWNGKEWTIQATPNPAEAKHSELVGVSCPTAEACTAVGSYVNASGVTKTVAERWSGKEWLIQTTPNALGAESSWLRGVSCGAVESCIAIGRTETPEASLAERYS